MTSAGRHDGIMRWRDRNNIKPIHGAPCHSQTQGKTERWHQTLKNRILLENDYMPGDLKQKITTANTKASAMLPQPTRAQEILRERQQIKRQTIHARRLHHDRLAAETFNPSGEPNTPFTQAANCLK